MSSISDPLQVVHKRLDVLRFICEQQPSKRELVDASSKSRPTVDRAIRELEEYNLVWRINGLCKPTLAGKKACELYVDVVESFDILNNAKTELSSLPLDSDLPTAIFHGGSVFQPSAYAPYERVEPLYKDLSQTDSLVAVTRVFLSPYLDQILSRGASGEMDVRLLIDEGILDAVPSTQKPILYECAKSGEMVYTVDEPPEYSLFLIDNEVLYIALYSESNHLSTVIQNMEKEAIEWSKNLLSQLQERSTRFRA